MTKKELFEIFNWLDKNVNKPKLLYFKLVDMNQISAYFKKNNQHFADFYINTILKSIKGDKDE